MVLDSAGRQHNFCDKYKLCPDCAVEQTGPSLFGHICIKRHIFYVAMSLFTVGWSGGAMVLVKLPEPGRPTNLDNSRARAYCACSLCGWELFGLFFLSSIISLFFIPLSGRRPDID